MNPLDGVEHSLPLRLRGTDLQLLNVPTAQLGQSTFVNKQLTQRRGD